jgi:hypothetical protein
MLRKLEEEGGNYNRSVWEYYYFEANLNIIFRDLYLQLISS